MKEGGAIEGTSTMGKGRNMLLLLAACLAASVDATSQCMSLSEASTEVYKFKMTQVRHRDPAE